VYRFLLSRRWLGFAVFVLVIAGLSIRLGTWQWDRLDRRQLSNERVTELLKQEPLDVARFTPRADAEWTRLTATGRYLDATTLTVKFTVREGSAGAEVVTPLLLPDGTAVLVDRGWLKTDRSAKRPTNIPAAPSGQVTVIGWWHPDNGAGSNATRPEDGQIRAISSRALASSAGADLRRGYLSLTDQSPKPGDELVLATPPDLGSGPHFFYGLQWWFFAGLAIVGYVWFARAEAKERRANGSR
jgi:cytochrome oxidase assembly protein ShyY1